MPRIIEILLVLIFSPILIFLFLMIVLLILLQLDGSIFHWSKRIGINNNIFLMPKFRTMKINTPQVASHLLTSPEKYLTKIGKLLRKTSLDELPQIYSILKGDMSIVGPRPALYNQNDLINKRKKFNVHLLKPGITGWAQINGRDDLTIDQKIVLDCLYLEKRSFLFDIKIILLTILRIFKLNNVSH